MNLVQQTASYVEGLTENLQWTAEWRRGKTEQFPDGDRNLKAAVLLEELAKQVGTLSGGDLDQQLVSLWGLLKRQVMREISLKRNPNSWEE